MERILLLRNQLNINQTKNKTRVQSSYDYFNFDYLLNKEEREYRIRVRTYLESQVLPNLTYYLEQRKFPKELMIQFVNNFPGIIGLSLKGYECAGFSPWLSCAIAMELGRCDLSFATFFMVDGGELVMRVIYELGSEEHRQKYLKKMNTLEIIGSFCLTEPNFGSDASNLQTSSEEVEEGYIINGEKCWIGNALDAHILIVWARNTKTQKVEGYIVDSKLSGVNIQKMDIKFSTRSVENCIIKFENVKISKDCKLPKANDFQSGVNQSLLGSRLGIAWIATGACIGAYDRVIEYISQRKQFNKSLSSFQLIQEKLARIMGNIQAMIFMNKRGHELYISKQLSIGQAGLCKAWTTKLARETLLLAREMLGGNGILLENWVMKTLLDLESCHTYEGTYDINMLVAGRELTGKSSFK
jgi:acyl-CoA oxidase